MKNIKMVGIVMAAVMSLGLLNGCSSNSGSSISENNASGSESKALAGTVTISGSTSMEKLAKALAEIFMAKNDGVTVDVQLGGSSVGIKNAADGISDIGNVSRDLKDSETGLTTHIIAIDGISVIVNKENTVTELTAEQLARIYKGEIKNWSEVGGEDMAIVVIGREAGSGTRGAFEEILGITDGAKYGQELTETGAVKTSVQTTKGAIGYISMAYADDSVIPLKVDGAEATEENAKAGVYKLSRPFIMVTKEGEQRSEVKAFLEFALGTEGQEIVTSLKLISVK